MRSRLKSVLTNINEEKGSIFPLVLILLLVGGLMIPALLSYMGSGILSGKLYDAKSEELYAADGGVMDALWVLENSTPEEFEDLCLIDPETGKYIYTYELPDLINDKTVRYVIEIDGDGYIITSTATGPDGSSTTIEAQAKAPSDAAIPVLFAAASMEENLTIGADLGHGEGTSWYEEVGIADGTDAVFDLDFYPVKEGTELVTIGGALPQTNYTIDYTANEGQLQFDEAPYQTNQVTDELVGTTDGDTTDFYLDYPHIVELIGVTVTQGGVPVPENDYTVDYENGLLHFSTAPGQVTDEVVDTADGITANFYLDYYPVEAGSETVTVGTVEQTDYTLDYGTGLLHFNTAPGSVTDEAVGTTDGITADFYLDYYPVEAGSETVTIGTVEQTDYTLDYGTGLLHFNTVPPTMHVTDEAVGTGNGATEYFYLDYSPVVAGSAYVYVGTEEQTDYTINYDTGLLHFNTAPGLVTDEAVGTGNGSTTDFSLAHSPVIAGSEEVYVDDVLQTREETPGDGGDYTINYVNGELSFITAPVGNIVASYRYSVGIAATYDYSEEIEVSYRHSAGIMASYDYQEEIVASYDYFEKIVAFYDYLEHRVNIYANGDCILQGTSSWVYADIWLTEGHNVIINGNVQGHWITHTTDPLRIIDDGVDDPYDENDPGTYQYLSSGNYTINGGTAELGPIHITGKLGIRAGAVVTLKGTVWVEGGIDTGDCAITGEDSEGNYYFMVSEADKTAINLTGGDPIEAIMYAPNGEIAVAGGVNLIGSVIGLNDVSALGSANLDNFIELEEVPETNYAMDILYWKIY